MKDLSDKEFILIRDYIKDNYGIHLSEEKKSLIYSRLRPVLQENEFDNFTQYYNYLVSDKSGKASMIFIDKMTTNHTFFMREVEHFYFFKDKVLPYIKEENSKDCDIRIWCAGCSSGEEAYTLQMFMRDYFSKNGNSWNTDLLATDISNSVLNKAYRGIYSNEQIKPLPDNWKKNYFKRFDNSHVIVSDDIKNKVIFRKLNLMEPAFPFKKKFDVIFCRNVMIYFDNSTRNELVEKFYDISNDGAYLFIGHSESLNNTGTRYKYIMPAVYRKA